MAANYIYINIQSEADLQVVKKLENLNFVGHADAKL